LPSVTVAIKLRRRSECSLFNATLGSKNAKIQTINEIYVPTIKALFVFDYISKLVAKKL